MCNKLFWVSLTATVAMSSALAQVTPPPLPAGSARLHPQTGQNEDESRRMLRAHKHHHRFHYRKDVTRDDSEDDDQRGAKSGKGRDDGDRRNQR